MNESIADRRPTRSPQRASRSQVLHIRAARKEVFSLLCPVREAEYLSGWKADILYSESGVAEEGCVFRTQRPGMAPSIWTITKHDANAGRIEFVVVTPESHVTFLHLDLVATPGNACDVTFTYTHRAISDVGCSFIAEFTDDRFRKQMNGIEESLNAYLSR